MKTQWKRNAYSVMRGLGTCLCMRNVHTIRVCLLMLSRKLDLPDFD